MYFVDFCDGTNLEKDFRCFKLSAHPSSKKKFAGRKNEKEIFGDFHFRWSHKAGDPCRKYHQIITLYDISYELRDFRDKELVGHSVVDDSYSISSFIAAINKNKR